MRFVIQVFLVFFISFLSLPLNAKNVVYIVVEGVSRDTLYSLIKEIDFQIIKK